MGLFFYAYPLLFMLTPYKKGVKNKRGFFRNRAQWKHSMRM